MDFPGRLEVGQCAEFDEAIEDRLQALPYRPTVIGTQRIAENGKAPAVVAFDQFHHQVAHRMVREIRREIANSDDVARATSVMRKHRFRRTSLIPCISARASQLFGRSGVGDAQQKRVKSPIFGHHLAQLRDVAFGPAPVAGQLPGHDRLGNCFPEIRLERNRTVIACQSFIETPQFLQRVATIVVGLGIAWLDRNRSIIARQSFVERCTS